MRRLSPFVSAIYLDRFDVTFEFLLGIKDSEGACVSEELNVAHGNGAAEGVGKVVNKALKQCSPVFPNWIYVFYGGIPKSVSQSKISIFFQVRLQATPCVEAGDRTIDWQKM